MKPLKICLKLVCVVLISIVVGMAVLATVYCIPVAPIKNNLVSSAELLKSEGLYLNLNSDPSSRLDNFTDTLMLQTAGYQITQSPLTEAILANRLKGSFDGASPLDSLLLDISGENQSLKTVSYARYWHGYLVFLKPLLLIFSYGQLRNINTFIQCALIALLFALLIKKKMYLYTVPTAFLFIFQRMSATVRSLQFSNIFYIYIIGMIVLLLFYEKWKGTSKILLYFTLLGVATSFIDLLTYPLVTFGVPTALLLVLEKRRSLIEQLKTVVFSGLAWILGFAGMWLGKGLLGSVITGQNILSEIFSAVQNRSVGTTENITLIETLRLNVGTFSHPVFLILAGAICLLFTVLIILRFLKAKQFSNILNNLGFLLICIAPFCWYVVLKQHSYIHFWFTYRTLLPTLFSAILMLIKIFNDAKKPS